MSPSGELNKEESKNHHNIKPQHNDYANLCYATHCSIGLFILSIATNSVQNVESQALTDGGYDKLGFFELALLYWCLGVGSLFARPIMEKFGGPRLCIVLGSVFDALWILTSIPPALQAKMQESGEETSFVYSDSFIYFTTTLTSILGGFGEALQWVALGKYVSDCATVRSKGFFFGYFWAFYMAS